MTIWRGNRVPHDALWRLAQYHVQSVQTKLDSAQSTGIRYDGMSAIIALAFAVEALLNFVGDRKLKSTWNERDSYAKKIKALELSLAFQYDRNVEPFKTLDVLKATRDKMAHGKPAAFAVEAEGTAAIASALQPEWAQSTSPVAVLEASRQVEAFKDFLLKRARIKSGAQFSSAFAEGE